LISIIIPVKEVNDYLRKETIPAILKQNYQQLEIVILPDRPSNEKFVKTKIIPSWPKTGPADKRDLGAIKARGKILAFLDDDSYPAEHWLNKAIQVFGQNKEIAGVCGPTLTPPDNNLRQKASGYVWSSWLGSGGAGTYRCAISHKREVDDYPSVNLLVRKQDFLAAGGFSSSFWPGEDTKLCHDLVYKLGKKIIYDPKILVYHHRREVFGSHLKQISRYALHRGHFARIMPRTSLRFGYVSPSIFVLGLFGGPILIFVLAPLAFLYYLAIILYLIALFFTAYDVFRQEGDFKVALLVIPSIFVTHLVYGVLFIKGFLTPKLKSRYQQ